MKSSTKRILTALAACFVMFVLTLTTGTGQQAAPKTIKEAITGTPTFKTEILGGTVEYVEGNDLVVRMSDGKLREFHVAENRKFIIEGKQLSVRELKPGTILTATVITKTTPVTDRTTTVGTAKVWWVSGRTVVLTLPNGENREYVVNDNYKFIVDGKEATVQDLKKGMTVHAEKIVEEPRTEIAENTVVTGQLPPAKRSR